MCQASDDQDHRRRRVERVDAAILEDRRDSSQKRPATGRPEPATAVAGPAIPGDFTRRIVRGDHPQILIEADAPIRRPPAGRSPPSPPSPRGPLSRPAPGLRRGRAQAPFEVVVHPRYNPEAITAYTSSRAAGRDPPMTLVMMTSLGVTRERERGTRDPCWRHPCSRSR